MPEDAKTISGEGLTHTGQGPRRLDGDAAHPLREAKHARALISLVFFAQRVAPGSNEFVAARRRAAHAAVPPLARPSPRRAVFTLPVHPAWQIAAAQKSIDAFILRHNISKKSPLTGIRTGALVKPVGASACACRHSCI